MRAINFSNNFYSSIKTVGATVLGCLWALGCAGQESQKSENPNISIVAFIVSDITALIETEGSG